ncbi:MAG TPA: NUDIX domain-containing protein [Thermoanaerobaculia bacterium]|nr:NUDIX domain-containing protein [Thermoanaerobaculia bacterium]
MLQQTTVGAVRGRYEAFLERFPDLRSLARAREDDVLAAWSGLGYYARARHLRLAAREIAGPLGGVWPRRPEELRRLPGFGEYMAAAVSALAFGRRSPAADANVTRVLCRLDAIGRPAGSRGQAEAVRAFASGLLARGRPGDVMAALMDLGQLVCTPRRPACEACPLADLCVARVRGAVARYPRRKPRPKAARVCVAAACALRDGRALLVRGESSPLRGLWQFPSAEGTTAADAARRLARALRSLGIAIDRRGAVSSARHTIMNRRLDIRVYPGRSRDAKLENRKTSRSVRWFTPERLNAAAIPTLTRRVARAAGFLPAV